MNDPQPNADRVADHEPGMARVLSPSLRALDRWESLIGTSAFVILLPGYFVYHTLFGRGYIPRFLSGYWTIVALLLLPILAIPYGRRFVLEGYRMPAIDAAFLGFLGLLTIVTLGNLSGGASSEVAVSHLSSVVLFVTIYLAFKFLDLDSVPFRRAAIASFVAVTGLVFWNATDGSFLRSTLELEAGGERVADYQGYGFVYMVLLVFVAGTLRSVPARTAAYLVAIPALFINGARSEFIAIFVGIAMIEYCYARRRFAFAATGLAAAAGLLVAGGLLLQVFQEQFPTSRVLALLGAVTDESTNERVHFFWNAWDTVATNPLTGRFASYRPGEYAHNALSAWVDLGLPGFVYYACLLLVPLAVMLRRFARESRRHDYVVALAFAMILLLLSVAAKDFTYRLFPVAMALFARWNARSIEALPGVPGETNPVPGELG